MSKTYQRIDINGKEENLPKEEKRYYFHLKGNFDLTSCLIPSARYNQIKKRIDWHLIEVDNSTEAEISEGLNDLRKLLTFIQDQIENNYALFDFRALWNSLSDAITKIESSQLQSLQVKEPEKIVGVNYFAEDLDKEVQPVSAVANDAYYDRDKLFERQPAKQKQSEVSEREIHEKIVQILTDYYRRNDYDIVEATADMYCVCEEYAALKGK